MKQSGRKKNEYRRKHEEKQRQKAAVRERFESLPDLESDLLLVGFRDRLDPVQARPSFEQCELNGFFHFPSHADHQTGNRLIACDGIVRLGLPDFGSPK